MFARKPILAIAVTFLTVGTALPYTATKEFRKTFPYDPEKELEVRNVNGSITVTAWDQDEIEVYAEINVRSSSRRDAEEYLEEVEVHVRETTRRIAVEAEYPRLSSGFFDWLFGRRRPEVNVRFWIKVPHKPVELSLHTVNGSLEIEEAMGRLSFTTTNGRIEAREVKGDLEANTVNGSVRLELASVDRDARIEAKTVNGSIRVYLPEDTQADIEASTVNGRIGTDFPLELSGKYAGKRATGTIHGGGALIRLRTVNGSIDILER